MALNALALSLFLLCGCSVAWAAGKQHRRGLQTAVPQLVVLGDSLSDTGNLFTLTKGALPPPKAGYWQGHFSNGPVWLEYVANMSGVHIVNYAFGGSTACTYAGSSIPPLGSIVNMVIQDAKNFSSNRAGLIWSGHNDFIVLLNAAATLPAAQVLARLNSLSDVVTPCLRNNTERLLAAGVFDQLALTALVPMQDSPAILSLVKALGPLQGSVINALIVTQIEKINAEIRKIAADMKVKYPSKTLQVWDAYKDMKYLLSNAASYNITNKTDGCINVISALNASAVPTFVCKDPSSYVYWDSVHPTTAAHSHIADEAIKTLSKLPVFNKNVTATTATIPKAHKLRRSNAMRRRSSSHHRRVMHL